MHPNKEFLENLLEAFENEEVIKKIDQLVKTNLNRNTVDDESSPVVDNRSKLISMNEDQLQQISQSQQTIKQLEEKVQQSRVEYGALQKQYDALKVSNLKLEESYHHTYKENQVLKSRWMDASKCYGEFLTFSDRVKSSLKGIFKGDSFEEFVICGVQYGSVESLWDYIKLEVIEEKGANMDILISLFTYFFHAHNKTFDSPLYSLEQTETGQPFDYDLHIRTGSSKVMGPITEVLLQGYRNKKTNKMIRKSVVKV